MCPVQCPTGMEYRQCGAGCSNDCSNLDEDVCMMSLADGCNCPDDQAFNEDLKRCVPLNQCKPCDSLGHYPGSFLTRDILCHLLTSVT